MDFGEGDAELGASQQRQVHVIAAVHQIHDDDLVEGVTQGDPGGDTALSGCTFPFRPFQGTQNIRDPPGLLGDVGRDQDNQVPGGPVVPQTPGHHHGTHAVRVGGDQGDKGFPGLARRWKDEIWTDLESICKRGN